jgi:HSP20 family protein
VAQTSENVIVEKLHTMKQRMELLFSESFKAEQSQEGSTDTALGHGLWEPSMDIWESDSLWLVTADLPGVADEDLHVEIAERRLTIRGNRKTLAVHEAMSPAQIERPAGTFLRTFNLPEAAEEQSIKAEFRRGVLTVAVSKTLGPEATPQKVRIRAG